MVVYLLVGYRASVCDLVVEREREIEGFTAQTYWTLAVELDARWTSIQSKVASHQECLTTIHIA